MSEKIKKIWAEDRIKLIVSFVSTFAIGLVAHAYGFLNNIFSHDSLNALYADSTENLAKISVGRFLVPVFRALRGPVALPWLIGLISLALISFSVYIVIKLFKVESKLSMVLISGLMVTNVTVIAIVGTYIHEFDFDMLSLLLSLVAVYCWQNAKKITSLIPAALAVTASMALYQSYVEVTVTVIIMLLIFDTLRGEKIKDVFLHGVKGAGFVAVGAGLYYAMNTVIIKLFETSQLERVDVFAEYETGIIDRIILMFKTIGVAFLSPTTMFPTVVICLVSALVLLSAVFFVVSAWKKEKLSAASRLFSVFLAGLMLFGLNFINILAHEGVHEVMLFSLWFVYVFAVVAAEKYAPELKKGNAVRAAAAVLTGILIWNNAVVANTAYMKKDLDLKATMTAYNRIISDLEERDDYTAGETEIAFAGYMDVQENHDAFFNLSQIIGMSFKDSTGARAFSQFFNPYKALFRYCFNYPMNISDESFLNDKRFENMPCYPEKGYIRNIDGVLVVNLGSVETEKNEDCNLILELKEIAEKLK